MSTRLTAGSGSLTVNLALFLGIAAGWASLAPIHFVSPRGWDGNDALSLVDLWSPFIDRSAGTEPGVRCPGPPASGRFYLQDAPMPRNFPAFTAEPLFACLEVGREGDIRTATLPRSSGSPAADAELLAAIARDWTLVHTSGKGSAGWQRVRLTRRLTSGFSPGPSTAGGRR